MAKDIRIGGRTFLVRPSRELYRRLIYKIGRLRMVSVFGARDPWELRDALRGIHAALALEDSSATVAFLETHLKKHDQHDLREVAAMICSLFIEAANRRPGLRLDETGGAVGAAARPEQPLGGLAAVIH
jgi:hypothetical protein